MNKTKNILISAFAGFLLGAAVMPPVMRWHFNRHWDPEKMHQHRFKRFSSKLALSPDQEAKISVIFDEKRKKMEALRAEMKPRFDEIRNTARAEINPLLTPDQQKKFIELETEREKFRHGPERPEP